jgi:hypothetical protein
MKLEVYSWASFLATVYQGDLTRLRQPVFSVTHTYLVDPFFHDLVPDIIGPSTSKRLSSLLKLMSMALLLDQYLMGSLLLYLHFRQ